MTKIRKQKTAKLEGQANKEQIEEAKPLIGQATKKEIKEWKELHGEIHYFVHESKIIYIKKPGRAEIGHGMTYGAGNVLEIAIHTMEACHIGGASELMKDEVFLQSAGIRFNELIELKQVELGKL